MSASESPFPLSWTLALAGLASAPVQLVVATEYLSVEAAQKALFPQADAFTEVVLPLSPAQRDEVARLAGPQPPHRRTTSVKRSEEHTSELQSRLHLVCRLLLEKKRHPRRFKIVVIDIQIALKQMLRDFIGIRVNRAKKSGMVNITSSVNSRERSGINTILHELNPLFTINVTMRDIKSKNVYSRVNSKATTQWRKFFRANGVHLESVASPNRSS